MTYTQAGGTANGEYYFHYDNFGNTTLLTDASGNRQYAALYDLNNQKIISEWNPNALVLVNQGEGKTGAITIKLPDAPATPIVFTGEGFIEIDLTYKPISWGVTNGGFRPDDSVGGGKTISTCAKRCPGSQVYACRCYYTSNPGTTPGTDLIRDVRTVIGSECPDSVNSNSGTLFNRSEANVCGCYDTNAIPDWE
jgi:hypothetical protein